MANFLPSKKFILILAILASGAGGFWLYKSQLWRQPSLSYDVNSWVAGNHDASNIDADKDSDGDGLKDWQEKLFGTDFNNPDTDGDGTLDGEENLGEAGLAPGVGPVEDMANSEGDPKTISQKFMEEAITGFMVLRSSGLSDDKILEVLLDKFQKDYGRSDLLADTYSVKDVLATASTPDEIRKYANSVAEIFESDFRGFDKSEPELLNELSESENPNPELLSTFEAYETAYRDAANRLKSVYAPAPYISYHADLINNFQNLAVINGALKSVVSDPLNAVFYINPYRKESERFQSALSGIASQLTRDGVSFQAGEAGGTLLNYLAKSS